MYENILTMDKAKTIEYVRLIDYDYSQNMVKVWLRLIQRSVMKCEVWKIKDLRSKFLIWKDMKMFAQQVISFWKQCVKNLTRMDKATKTIECVKLIDYEYSQNMVKVWLGFNSGRSV